MSELSRRGFLRSGGLLLAFSLGCRDQRRDASSQQQPRAELNAWICVDPDDTVTLRIAESEMGQGILTALSMILAEELDADWSKVRAEHAPADFARYGKQGTGGSTSIRQGWQPMRLAGARARAMLIAAAADQLGVPVGELTTEHSAVVHALSQRRLRYGELAAAAAAKQPPEAPPLKDAKRYRLVGKAIARLDTPAKVTGAATYGLDVRLPELCFAVVARPPTLGGSLRSYDAERACAVPGVLRVVQVPFGLAVIATNTWAALRGRDALAIEWNDGPHRALSSASISQALAAALHPRQPSAPSHVAKDEGHALVRLAKARRRVTATYEAPYLAHAAMEPLNCTVRITDDGCQIWTGTQRPTEAQKTAADALGIAVERVEVTTTFLGGGFGRRSQSAFIGEAVQIAKQLAAPVQVVWTRQDDMRAGYYRPAALAMIEAGLDDEGWPIAWVHRIASPSIREQMGALKDGIDDTSVEGVVTLPYALDGLRVTYANPRLPLSTWFWRSVGSSQNAWMVESFLDEVARAGGKDPLALRRKLLAGKPRHLAVLDKVAAAARWGEPVAAGRALGLALHESFGSFVALIAEVSLTGGAPRVHQVWCAVDAGRLVNPNTVIAQMESGIIYGLSAALHGKVEVAGGAVTTGSFADYQVVRMPDTPTIEVLLVESDEEPGGIGEPSTPVIAPAVCNALLALTGEPVRRLPIRVA